MHNHDAIDQVTPGEKWQFDGDVAHVFDNMLKRSIPQYETMRQSCFDLACRFVKSKTDIVDLGCARGEALDPLVAKYGAYNRFIGVEISKPMLEASRARYRGYIDCSVVDIRECDLRKDFPPCNASVIMAILTIQFTPIEYRPKILRQVYKALIPGGAFIFVEKIIGATADIDSLIVDEYYRMKNNNGYSQDDIERKRLSLEGVLVPVTAKWNEDLLRSAGFTQIDCFWRWMNFAGWVAIKE